MASPAVLLTLQLYTPLSDAWDRVLGVSVWNRDSPESRLVWEAIREVGLSGLSQDPGSEGSRLGPVCLGLLFTVGLELGQKMGFQGRGTYSFNKHLRV